MIPIKEIYWAAGIIEGEGCFALRRGCDLVIEVCMTDADIIKKLFRIFGIGTIRYERKLPSGKTAYSWRVSNQGHCAGLMMTLLPIMGKRRADKITDCLAAW